MNVRFTECHVTFFQHSFKESSIEYLLWVVKNCLNKNILSFKSYYNFSISFEGSLTELLSNMTTWHNLLSGSSSYTLAPKEYMCYFNVMYYRVSIRRNPWYSIIRSLNQDSRGNKQKQEARKGGGATVASNESTRYHHQVLHNSTRRALCISMDI